jgi:predicted RNase H-like HicB family nuclease
MTEIVFLVEKDPDGGFVARAVGESIFTQAETMEALREQARDAVRCHFGETEALAKTIQLRMDRGQGIAQ